MRRVLFPFLLVAVLIGTAGCEYLGSATTEAVEREFTAGEIANLRPANKMAVYKHELLEFTHQANIYAAKPFCDRDKGIVVACSVPEVIVANDKLLQRADEALRQAEAFVNAVGSEDAIAQNAVLLAALRVAVSELAFQLVKRGII
jgi:hypothetical protein